MTRRTLTIHARIDVDPKTRDRIDGLVGRRVQHVDAASMSERLPEVEVLLSGDPPRVDWSRARRLVLLQLMGSGVDTLWPAAGLPAEVEIANARGIHLPEMRDHALALMLALERRLPRLLRQQARREWTSVAAGSLAGKTAGIFGLGEVGRSVAAACAALGMRVIGTRAEPRPTAHVDEVYGAADAERVLDAADHLVVTLPLTTQTRGLLSARALARLRPTAFLVNLSRGGIVDLEALDALLRANRLAGAALDVFDEEPLAAASPLWITPNLIITPHVAGLVPDYLERAVAVFRENLDLVERGLPPRTRVDRTREY